MKIRILFIELLLVIAVIGTISAGGKQEQPTDKKEAVKIAFWIPGSDKVSEDYFYQAAKDFTTRNPRIQVEVTILPPAAPDISTKLNAAKLSNTYPDVFSSFIVFIGARGTRGEFADLTPFIEKWPEKDDFYGSSFELGKYKGKIYGISYFPAPEILVYRKDFFKEAGLDPEKPPRNWDELEAYALKLAKRDANNNVVRAGLDIPAINPEVFIKPFLWQNGAAVLDEEKELPTLDDPKALEAFQYVKRLIDAKISIPYDYQKKSDIPFVKGNAAMSFIMASTITNTLKANPQLREIIGFSPPLEKRKKVPFTGHRLFTVYHRGCLEIQERGVGVHPIHAFKFKRTDAFEKPTAGYAYRKEIPRTGVLQGWRRRVQEGSAGILSIGEKCRSHHGDRHLQQVPGGSLPGSIFGQKVS